ncbi:hypothetical protein DPMN_054477 [Dreissena polymorpha]|uniref:Uncharacterized protein n=1 Tax=Dreissena polymorpha TaxID=45954 RepID=A0A9D4CN71_DREPO|nr:hypothetical protein DPMN_054477 [Dreissena polymorpha]
MEDDQAAGVQSDMVTSKKTPDDQQDQKQASLLEKNAEEKLGNQTEDNQQSTTTTQQRNQPGDFKVEKRDTVIQTQIHNEISTHVVLSENPLLIRDDKTKSDVQVQESNSKDQGTHSILTAASQADVVESSARPLMSKEYADNSSNRETEVNTTSLPSVGN